MNLTGKIQKWLESFVPLLAHKDAETLRHCRLMIGFGFLGGIFGLIYTVFYLLIGHYYGAAIIAFNDACFFAVPFMLKHARRGFSFHGHFFCAVLTTGFASLSAIEGGVRGHAIMWLVTVPFCAVLLIGVRPSYVWWAICVTIAAIFGAIDLEGVRLPYFYAQEWHALITVMGYLGLAFFLFFLAHIFESGRLEAHHKMIDAYHELARATSQLVHSNEDLGRANTNLAKANEQLTQLNREKNEFIGIAAHDLKNPLAAVMGYAEILSMQQQPNREGNTLFGEKIKTAAERMLHLVKNLLDINTIEEGRMKLKNEDVNAGRLLEQTIGSLQLAAQHKNIAIHFTPPTNVYVIGDPTAFSQIAENFLSNAIKYSPPERNVYIRINATRDHVMLEFEDQGPGLSKEDQAQLFQKYARLTPQPTGGESSNGLGLSIVKRLAEGMGGRVGCRSELGKGTTFWVALRGYSASVAA